MGIVTEADVLQVSNKCFEYMVSHSDTMVSFDNGFVKIDGTYRKVFWVSIGLEPWPFQLLATREDTQSFTPQEAFEKAVKLAESTGRTSSANGSKRRIG